MKAVMRRTREEGKRGSPSEAYKEMIRLGLTTETLKKNHTFFQLLAK